MRVVIDEEDGLLAVLRPTYLDYRGFGAIRDVIDVVDVKRILDLVFLRQRIQSVKIPRIAVILKNSGEAAVWSGPFNHGFLADENRFFGSNDYWHTLKLGMMVMIAMRPSLKACDQGNMTTAFRSRKP
jgi:hypothetical protein